MCFRHSWARFIEQRESICVKFERRPRVYELATFSILPSRFFVNLVEHCKPIAVKYRKYSKQDKEFIVTEVNRLPSKEIIEPSTSPWRVQVVVTTNERRKNMVVDYSQTVKIHYIECLLFTQDRRIGKQDNTQQNL